jgi:drug/metabolite transporter (DMT)-like permease
VFLGWLILSEPVTAIVLGGGLLVVLGVALVVSGERPRAAEVEQAQPPPVPEPARSS